MPWSQNRAFSVDLVGAPDVVDRLRHTYVDQPGISLEALDASSPEGGQPARCRVTVDAPADSPDRSLAGARLQLLLGIVEQYAPHPDAQPGSPDGLAVENRCVS